MSVEYDKIIQSPLETLNLLEIGNAVRQCDNKVLLASLDTFVQKLVKLIKVNHSSNPVIVPAVVSIIKELLRRLCILPCSSPQCLSILVSTILSLVSDPSIVTQVACMNCISCILHTYPGCLKPHRETIISWTKNGLYSGKAQLVQASAVLIVSLHSTSAEMSQLFDSFLQLLDHSFRLLMGEDGTLPQSYYTPVLPLQDEDHRLSTIITTIQSLTRVLCYSLIVNGGSTFNVSLNKVMDIIWFATSCKVMSLSLTLVIQQISWQLLFVVIQSFESYLLPYSESIEALIAKRLQDETTPPMIISLVCKCIEKWVIVRGYCSRVFICSVVESLCVMGHGYIKKNNDFAMNNKQFPCEATEIWLLYYCIRALCACLKVPFAQSALPDILVKGSYLLSCQMPPNLPPCISSKINELKTLTSAKATTLKLTEEMSKYTQSSFNADQSTTNTTETQPPQSTDNMSSVHVLSNIRSSLEEQQLSHLSQSSHLSQTSPLTQRSQPLQSPKDRPVSGSKRRRNLSPVSRERNDENNLKKQKNKDVEFPLPFVDEADTSSKDHEKDHEIIEDEEDKDGLLELPQNEEEILLEIFD